MILLSVDEIILLHEKLIKVTGGINGLRDYGLLESAVFSTQTGFGDMEKYPTIEEKSARIAFSLINDHAFVDGNKRIGILAMLMTLRLNNVNISYTQQELIDLGLTVADGSIGYEQILQWIKGHKK